MHRWMTATRASTCQTLTAKIDSVAEKRMSSVARATSTRYVHTGRLEDPQCLYVLSMDPGAARDGATVCAGQRQPHT